LNCKRRRSKVWNWLSGEKLSGEELSGLKEYWRDIGVEGSEDILEMHCDCDIRMVTSRVASHVYDSSHTTIELGYYHSLRYLLEETENSKHSAVWTTKNYFIISVKLLVENWRAI